MTDYSKFLMESFDNSPYINIIQDTEGDHLGYCKVGLNKYEVHLKSDLDPDIKNIVKLHEYGHIDFGHMRVESSIDKNIIKEYLDSINKSEYFNDYNTHMIINISMDIEINSKLLSIKDTLRLRSAGFEPCSPTAFKVQAGLPYKEYLIPVTDHLIQNSTVIQMASRVIDKLGDTTNDSDPNGIPINSKNPSNNNNNGSNKKSNKLKNDSNKNDSNEDGESNSESNENKLTEDPNAYSKKDSDEDGEVIYQPTSDGFGNGIGTSSVTHRIAVLSDIDMKIVQFLDRILPQPIRTSKPDSIKPMLRKSKGDSNLIYTSRRYKILREDIKLAIIVDISGSMDESVVSTAVNTVSSMSNRINPQSKLLLTNTKVESILDIRSNQSISIGGGTEISVGVDKAAELGFNTILIISDFCTDDDNLLRSITKHRAAYYGIFYNYDKNQCVKSRKLMTNELLL